VRLKVVLTGSNRNKQFFFREGRKEATLQAPLAWRLLLLVLAVLLEALMRWTACLSYCGVMTRVPPARRSSARSGSGSGWRSNS
jgi:hypothetical protein